MQPRAPRGLAGLLTALFAALVLYASLYPFAGWRWPPGRDLVDLLWLPWPPYRLPFDMAANFFGYIPLGLLAGLAASRSGRPAWLAVGLAAALPAALSYAAEVAQNFLPGRHPSLRDWTLNAAGGLAGALLVPVLQALGWPQRMAHWLRRWLAPEAGGAVLLLVLWPVALLFPAPVALGLGQIGPVLRPLAAEALEGVPWAAPWAQALAAASAPSAPLDVPTETLVTALGLLAPCLVAFAVVPPGWRRLGLSVGAAALTVGVMMLSTALNFGPQHALAWVTSGTVAALALGTLAAAVLAPLPRRLAAGLGLIAITALVVLVAQAPADPYFAQSLLRWEQGRFIRFHGLAQWVGWLWPYVALVWLLTRVGARS
jgi:VanZ family protein